MTKTRLLALHKIIHDLIDIKIENPLLLSSALTYQQMGFTCKINHSQDFTHYVSVYSPPLPN